MLVPLVAYAVTSRQDKTYEASAKLLLGSDAAVEQALQGGTAPAVDQGVAATSLDLASLNRIAVRTASALGGVTPDEISGAVEVIPRGDSSVVDILATGGRREQVAPIANAYADSYIAFRREDARSGLRRVEDALNSQISRAVRAGREGRANELREKRDDLRLLQTVQSGGAELVERAVTPLGAASPKPRRAAIIGAGFGLILGIGLALLFDVLSRRLTDPKEAESLFDSPLLGTIPSSRAVRDASASSPPLPAVEQAAFQRVRTNMLHYNDYNISSIAVVSALPEEGKSTVAWNIAVAGAEAGARVVLVEGDLRRPSFVRRIGVPDSDGVTAVLQGVAHPKDVIRRLSLNGNTNGSSAARTLDVIPAGEAHANPTYLIESERMERLVLDLEERYDLVVIDTPPALVVSDSMALVDRVSGVVVVSRMGRNTRDAAEQLRRHLENARAPVLGVVINGVGPLDGVAGYGYAYERTASGR
ncbi:MAG: polysaccharide biosynthesis tyrosine autokinase [Solirubrobacteraceae bacterium]|nr:polysaccharide biosynthesis tyrosine autokinase [Solirubrobacteraceae bacterium]